MRINHFPIAKHLAALEQSPITTVLLERDCLALGLSTFRVARQTFIASDRHGRSMAFNNGGTALNARPAAPLTQDKHSTRLILHQHGLPAPRGRRFRVSQIEAAQKYSEDLGYPLVVKPLHGTQGQGVVTGIASRKELQWAFEDVSSSLFASDDVIVEEHIDGEAYRIMVVGDRAVSALISRRGTVMGDGVQTVRELLNERQRLRLQNPHLMSRPIRMDERMDHLLERQQTSLDDVLNEGQAIDFTYGSNTSQGGEPAQVIDAMHPSILEASVAAVQAIPGLGFAGVDILVPDIDKPLTEQRAAICEINSLPAVDSHEYPVYGESIVVSRHMVSKAAEHSGLITHEYSKSISLKVTLDCRSDNKKFNDWLQVEADKLGIRCRLKRPRRSGITAKVRGDAAVVAVWIALVFHNSHHVRIRSTEAQHA